MEAYMHNLNLVYIALFFTIALAMAAIPVGVMNLGRLEASFEGCERLFAKSEGNCFIRVVNPGPDTSWAVSLRCGDERFEPVSIEAGHTRRLAFTVRPPERGRHTFGPIVLESLFPLGTIRFELPVSRRFEAIVYPRSKGRPLQEFLARQEAPFGEESDFDGVSSYHGTQSASRIHWPSVAKGEVMVKHFSKEREEQHLLFDFQKSGRDDEARLSQLTLWTLECEKRGLPFAIRMPDRLLESRKESIDAILETLATY
jgi:uncharacterized protein (DUF58 family)